MKSVEIIDPGVVPVPGYYDVVVIRRFNPGSSTCAYGAALGVVGDGGADF